MRLPGTNSRRYIAGVNSIIHNPKAIDAAIEYFDCVYPDALPYELRSIMRNDKLRHHIVNFIGRQLGFRVKSSTGCLTCWVYAAICYVILKHVLLEDPIIYLGSDNPTGKQAVVHVWTENAGDSYDYGNNPEGYRFKVISYDGHTAKVLI